MAICSYLVMPAEGTADSLIERLGSLPCCEVTRALNREVLILVTDTDGTEEEEALQRTLAEMEDIQALLLTFGEITP